jgi:hypothetical protein
VKARLHPYASATPGELHGAGALWHSQSERGLSPRRMDWRYEPAYPVASLKPLMPERATWRSWWETEVQYRTAEWGWSAERFVEWWLTSPEAQLWGPSWKWAVNETGGSMAKKPKPGRGWRYRVLTALIVPTAFLRELSQRGDPRFFAPRSGRLYRMGCPWLRWPPFDVHYELRVRAPVTASPEPVGPAAAVPASSIVVETTIWANHDMSQENAANIAWGIIEDQLLDRVPLPPPDLSVLGPPPTPRPFRWEVLRAHEIWRPTWKLSPRQRRTMGSRAIVHPRTWRVDGVVEFGASRSGQFYVKAGSARGAEKVAERVLRGERIRGQPLLRDIEWRTSRQWHGVRAYNAEHIPLPSDPPRRR